MIRKKKPKFKRQVSFSKIKLGDKWRRPKGRHSKLRRHKKGRGSLPQPGYGAPKNKRGMHPCGLFEVMISNMSDLGKIDVKTQCARIRRTVGIRKRIMINEKAKELKIKILNPQRITKPEKKVKKKKEVKEKETKKEVKKETKPKVEKKVEDKK